MTQHEQTPFVEEKPVTTAGFSHVEFADNPEPRCACVLLLDVSGSMQGDAIAQLNLGLSSFKDELVSDPLAAKRVEVAVIAFADGVQVVTDFQSAVDFQPPTLRAGGTTAMGTAIRDGLSRLASRKDEYRANGVAYYRPWVFLITDGEPTDEYLSAAQAVREGEERGAFSFYAVGVNNANMEKLKSLSPVMRPPVKLDELRFRDLFVWLSRSMKTVSKSTMGNKVALEPLGWASTTA